MVLISNKTDIPLYKIEEFVKYKGEISPAQAMKRLDINYDQLAAAKLMPKNIENIRAWAKQELDITDADLKLLSRIKNKSRAEVAKELLELKNNSFNNLLAKAAVRYKELRKGDKNNYKKFNKDYWVNSLVKKIKECESEEDILKIMVDIYYLQRKLD